MEKTLRKNIYEAAIPLLEGRKVTDIIIGLSMLAVELDGNSISVAYVLRDTLGGGCSIFPYVQSAPGMDAVEAARWFVEGKDQLQIAIGGAVINAASQSLSLEDHDSKEHPFDLTVDGSDIIGMAGNIPPARMRLREFGPKFYVFDKGKCEHGSVDENVYPMEMQEDLLPKCSVLMASGTSVINDTAENLYRMAVNAREVVMVGASVPMIPEGYRDTPVTVLAGSWWRHEDKDEIWTLISRAAGLKTLGRFMVKKNVRIR